MGHPQSPGLTIMWLRKMNTKKSATNQPEVAPTLPQNTTVFRSVFCISSFKKNFIRNANKKKVSNRFFFCILALAHPFFLHSFTSWNPKQPFINGCFNWMIPNLYIGNGCFTKHPFINGCLGFQVHIIIFFPKWICLVGSCWIVWKTTNPEKFHNVATVMPLRWRCFLSIFYKKNVCCSN